MIRTSHGLAFKVHSCARCRRVTELFHCRATDEYLCEECIEDADSE